MATFVENLLATCWKFLLKTFAGNLLETFIGKILLEPFVSNLLATFVNSLC